jgi:hypothetical protein
MEVMDLKQITLRGIPREVERIIKTEAERRGLSLNKAFLSILEKAAGVKGEAKKKKTLYHDLDHLSGIWAKEETKAFEKGLKLQRKIDEALWKKTG